MKLRGIELTHVRRFANQRASLSGLGDGITVLAQPNEFGKSTFFDAIHALFFERHGSRNAQVRALQPHAGGGPEVAVTLDLPAGRFRIAKRWLQRPQASVTDGHGRLIAQADEAEAWIDAVMTGGLAGPSGLLWVRQGLAGLEPDGATAADRADRERGLATRRDLLSSVAGEIDMMTGGRRMDAVLDRVTEALARLATATGRPKAGGDWARAVDEAAALAAEEATLRPRADNLSGALARRAEVQRTLARLTDPQEAALRAQDLAVAQAGDAEARAHLDRMAQAEAALRLAVLNAERVSSDVAAMETMLVRSSEAEATAIAAAAKAREAQDRADDLAQRDREAAAAHAAAVAATRDLRQQVARAALVRAAEAARSEAAALQRRLERAAALQAARDEARARRARITVTAAALAAADKAQIARDLARARAVAQAVTIEARPDAGGVATVNGRPIGPGAQVITGPTEVALPGFGMVRVDPGLVQDHDSANDLARTDAAFDRALAACCCATVEEARAQWATAQGLDADIAQAVALLAEVAPDGLDNLRAALAAALAAADQDTVPHGVAPQDGADARDPLALAADLQAAEAREAEAAVIARTRHAEAIAAGNGRAAAEADRITAERHRSEAMARIVATAGDTATLAAQMAALQAVLPDLARARLLAEQTLAALRAAAPDPATTVARLARAQGAVDQAARATASAREEAASLAATIAALAEEGIEERLSAIAEARAAADARAARYQAEVAALTRLRAALDAARRQARETYFGPVLRELHPLLAILYPDARLTIDDGSLLPAALTRAGQVEALDILSGGTREQVAILTRLAFARLFAAAGRAVPVILDDALVHSDDDRIEAMFTALHRSARDQQILVLTCRQRAFAALGGAQAVVTVEPL